MATDADGVAVITWDTVGKSMNVMNQQGFVDLNALVNEALADNPALVNEDPLGEAWFFKVKVEDTGQVDAYMDEDAYKEMIA